jgi:hypothetical protein
MKGHRNDAVPFCLYTERSSTMRIDLNADVGESFGCYSMGDDAAVMRSVTSVSIAAGFHAGDPTVLRRTMRLARELGVAVGAHPGLPDLAGFGRREMRIAPPDLEDLVLYQVAAVGGVAASEGLPLQHVKPHGALYNMAVADRSVADAIVRAVAACSPSARHRDRPWNWQHGKRAFASLWRDSRTGATSPMGCSCPGIIQARSSPASRRS